MLEIHPIIIDPSWIKGSCPNCQKTIYIDEKNKRSLHKAPLCEWYTNFVRGSRSEGVVDLIKKTG